jgi:tRNA(Ile)-lysidine synthase
MTDHENIIDIKELSALLAGTTRALVGVSGGADSMVLLHEIVHNRDKFTNDFKVVHIDHQLNPASGSWGELVANYCQEHNIECEIVKVNTSEWGKNLEQAARRARYDAFAKQQGDSIVLAHHANDQIETFFLKLFRGSGVKGLRGMDKINECWFDRSKKVIRPLIDTSRHDIEAYALANNIPYVTDPSNVDQRYDRNWIRHTLIPTIQTRNEIADINILKSIANQGEAYELLTEMGKMDFDACKLQENELDWTKVRVLSLPRLKNLIMYICNMHNLIDVSYHHVETFAKGLLAADVDSKNELRLRYFTMKKIGNKIKLDV